MSETESRDLHPLDPDPPRPPGVPDLDLDVPVNQGDAHQDANPEEEDVDKQPAEAPD